MALRLKSIKESNKGVIISISYNASAY
jgi:hypothetical protein